MAGIQLNPTEYTARFFTGGGIDIAFHPETRSFSVALMNDKTNVVVAVIDGSEAERFIEWMRHKLMLS